MQKNYINWFEIPVSDFERGRNFYETILDIKLSPMDIGPSHQMAAFSYNPGSSAVSGAIMCGEGYTPTEDGALLYLNADPDLQIVLDRVEKAGGKVIMPKTQISEDVGYMALIRDTEGNRIALHSNP